MENQISNFTHITTQQDNAPYSGLKPRCSVHLSHKLRGVVMTYETCFNQSLWLESEEVLGAEGLKQQLQ